MTNTHEEKDWADTAEDLIEAGEWQEALDLLDGAPEDDGLRWLLSSVVWVAVHELERASEDILTVVI